MGFFTATDFALNVGIGVIRLRQVALKPRPVFAQVMPQTCHISPSLRHRSELERLRKIGRHIGDRLQVVCE